MCTQLVATLSQTFRRRAVWPSTSQLLLQLLPHVTSIDSTAMTLFQMLDSLCPALPNLGRCSDLSSLIVQIQGNDTFASDTSDAMHTLAHTLLKPLFCCRSLTFPRFPTLVKSHTTLQTLRCSGHSSQNLRHPIGSLFDSHLC